MKPGCCVDNACSEATCMRLPAGKTCADCLHCDRCTSMFGAKPTDERCGFYPRRFREPEQGE